MKLRNIIKNNEITAFKFKDDDNEFVFTDLDKDEPQAVYNKTHGYFMTLAEVLEYADDEVEVL